MEKLLKLREQTLKAEQRAKELRKKLTDTCHCPEEYSTKTSKYHSGGYDYNSSTTYITTCNICGKTTYKEVEHDF